VDGPQYYYMLNNIGTYGIFWGGKYLTDTLKRKYYYRLKNIENIPIPNKQLQNRQNVFASEEEQNK
jgi:hypothetical protein